MIEIVPAILPKSFAELEEKLASIRAAAPLVQVDAVDGIFAQSKTWPFAGGEMFSSIVAQEEGLPHWEDFDFQFDCMVAHPLKDAREFISAGASGVVLHHASLGVLEAFEALQAERAGDLGVELGVAFLPSDPAESFLPYRELADFVQVMGIARVGFQGSAFDPRALELVKNLRSAYPNLSIQVDGGVKLENARAIAQAGANRLVVGSAIFGSIDPHEAIKKLKSEVQ